MNYIEYDLETIKKKRAYIKEMFLVNRGITENLDTFYDYFIIDLLEFYDSAFFEDFFFDKDIEWKVKISNKMTRCAGAVRRVYKGFLVKISVPRVLRDANRYNYNVNGIIANNALDALMLVIEHEMIHAYQFCIYKDTNHGRTFKTEAYSIFGHTKTFYSHIPI